LQHGEAEWAAGQSFRAAWFADQMNRLSALTCPRRESALARYLNDPLDSSAAVGVMVL